MNYENFICAVEGLANKFNSTNTEKCIYINHTNYGMEITCLSREEMRNNWVEQMISEYYKNYDNESQVILCDPKHKVMVIRFDNEWGDFGYGTAKCSPDDKFNERIGLAVAFAHFRGYEIPNFV